MIQQTSLEAWWEVRLDLGLRQAQVYNTLKNNELNNRMIAETLNKFC